MAAAVRTLDDSLAVKVTNIQLRNEWGRWIDHAAAWDWFTTHTFNEDVFPDRALRLFDRLRISPIVDSRFGAS
jgi:hypothetical protein